MSSSWDNIWELQYFVTDTSNTRQVDTTKMFVLSNFWRMPVCLSHPLMDGHSIFKSSQPFARWVSEGALKHLHHLCNFQVLLLNSLGIWELLQIRVSSFKHPSSKFSVFIFIDMIWKTSALRSLAHKTLVINHLSLPSPVHNMKGFSSKKSHCRYQKTCQPVSLTSRNKTRFEHTRKIEENGPVNTMWSSFHPGIHNRGEYWTSAKPTVLLLLSQAYTEMHKKRRNKLQ